MEYLHYSRDPIVCLHDVDEQHSQFKPRGLWLSEGSAWLDWCTEHGFGGREALKLSKNLGFFDNFGPHIYVYRFELSKDPNVLEISSLDDLRELNKKYGSWGAVAAAYNGISVTNYQHVREQVLFTYDWCAPSKGIGTLWYLGLDVPCACIWRPSRAISGYFPLYKAIDTGDA